VSIIKTNPNQAGSDLISFSHKKFCYECPSFWIWFI